MKILKYILVLLALCFSASSRSGTCWNASKFVGNITTNGQVRSDFGQWWNQITAENECKRASIEGTRSQHNFTGCKNAYNCESFPDDPARKTVKLDLNLTAQQLNDYRVFNSIGINAKEASKNLNLKPGDYIFFGKNKVEYLIKWPNKKRMTYLSKFSS